MDTSDNMDSLDESSTLPELSFDDLLDPSPIKKSNKSYFDDDPVELDSERQIRTDDTLNTPGPKKAPILQKNTNNPTFAASVSKISTPVRTQAVKFGNSPTTLTNVAKANNGVSSTPVVLNSKNILPKTPQILNNSIKFTQKVVGGNGSTASLAGKTAVRTSTGQIIYIQKTPPTSNIKTTATTTVVKTQNIAGNNSKPVTIQVLRTSDGNYVPIKTSTSSASNLKTTLTLSPTSLAGKKIITSSGGQVIIKGTIKSTDSNVSSSAAKTSTTNAISGVRTVVKPLPTGQLNDPNKPKPIIVHGSGGKQIVVSNQNIVKLSPKSITTTAGGSSVTTSTSGSGQIHAIQIPGKIGLQYVRVLPSTKVATKPLNTQSTISVTSTVSSGSPKAITSTNQSMKILNALPQKFTVVQKGGTAKLVVAQKKEVTSTNSDFSPATTKLQKTIVTVPTIKTLNEDKNKNPQKQSQQQPPNKSSQQSLSSSSNGTSQSLVRKHKISEINSEIQRITTSTDNAGPPEVKKPTPSNRVLVVSNNSQPKILNNSIQLGGRISSAVTLPSNTTTATNKSIGGSMMQVVNVTQNGKKLYTVLKQPPAEQKAGAEGFSVLKTNNQTTTTTSIVATASSKSVAKPLINKQQLMQQQNKLLQLKQQQQNVEDKNPNAPTTSSSTYLLPIKIKDEPDDSASNANAEELPADQLTMSNLATTSEEENDALENLVGGVRRKHCNCSKSQCLKLYCDCFANGEFCQDCTCKDCLNNLENEDERQRAIKACLERNPSAFKPKITSSRDQADMRLHNKGCNCKRSGCLKNYCECFEAKIPCSSNCKCVGCRNVEDRPDLDLDPIDPKVMAAMGGAIDKRTYEKSQRDFGGSGSGISIKTEKLSKDPIKPLSSFDALGGPSSPTIERQQSNFITQEVIDATIQCMITQADECEKNNLPAYQTEKMVMEELGRCLVEIIDFSIRNTDNSYSQD